MAKRPDEALPPEVVPCAAFVMSDRFRDWAVAEMRREVMGQVSMAGLDRMAVVRTKPGAPAPRKASEPGTLGEAVDGDGAGTS
jgi:hypothetical protein